MKRPAAPWDPDVDDVFVCAAVRKVAPDTATIVLAPRHDSSVTFAAGQYVTIEFAIDGRQVSRCYTIASPPTRPERLSITVQRAASGAVSPWLHDGGLTVGSTVRLGPPQGEFTLERHPAPAYLFLTAGSGVTPALSVLREAYDLASDIDLVLVHSQRRASDVPYRRELDEITSLLPRVRMHVLCSAPDPADPTDHPVATRGRLDADLLARLVPDLAEREIFICGPDGYRSDARAAARASGAVDARIHEETFTLEPAAPTAPAAPADRTAPSGTGFRIEFRDHAASVDCVPGSSVLDAAIAAGLPLAFSCAQGLCGTCKSTLICGEVDMQHAGGIRPREIAAGKILLCCSTPRSDLVIATQS